MTTIPQRRSFHLLQRLKTSGAILPLPLRLHIVVLKLLFFSMALQHPWALASAFQFHDHYEDGRTPWTSDQPFARPLPKHRTTQTQNKHIHRPNIHALCGIRTHDPTFRTSEDSSCLRPLGYCDRPLKLCSRIILPYFYCRRTIWAAEGVF
jgi:hypothetical protein